MIPKFLALRRSQGPGYCRNRIFSGSQYQGQVFAETTTDCHSQFPLKFLGGIILTCQLRHFEIQITDVAIVPCGDLRVRLRVGWPFGHWEILAIIVEVCVIVFDVFQILGQPILHKVVIIFFENFLWVSLVVDL